jgi:hypothetical protein
MPRFEGPKKEGLKRKRRRKAWASMDDILSTVQPGEQEIKEASSEETVAPVEAANESPTSGKANSSLDEARKPGPIVPSSNQEQTGNKNQEHELSTEPSKEDKPHKNLKSKDTPNQEHELGTDQEHELGTNSEHKPSTLTGYSNQEQTGDKSSQALAKKALERESRKLSEAQLHANQEQQLGTNQEHELGTDSVQPNSNSATKNAQVANQIPPQPVRANQEQTGNMNQEQGQNLETGSKTNPRIQSTVNQNSNINKDENNESPSTGNKPGTNQKQTGNITSNKPGTRAGTNQEQTGNVPGTNQVQNWGQNWDKNRVQTGNINPVQKAPQKPITESLSEDNFYLEQQILSLSGHAERCFRYIAERSFQNNQEAFETTYSFVAQSLEIHVETLKTTLKRLKKRNLVINNTLRMGGPAARRYLGIPPVVLAAYSKLLFHQKGSLDTGNKPGTLTGNRLGSEPGSKLGSDPSSKLVSNNILTTREENLRTTQEQTKPDFSDVSITAVAHLGITSKHLRDIENQKLQLSQSQLEDFISRFAIYASNPANIANVRNKAALFIKMVQSLSRGEDVLSDIKSEEDEILEAFLKRKEEAKKRRLELEKRALDMEFSDWLESLSEAQRDEYAPPTSIVESGSENQNRLLKQWYSDNIWPEKKKEILNGTGNGAGD